MQQNQQVGFLSDGGEDVRNVQLYLNPRAEHLLDWFHLTMRLTVLTQTAQGLPERVGEGEDSYELRPGVLKSLGADQMVPVARQRLSGLEGAAGPGNGFGRRGFRG